MNMATVDVHWVCLMPAPTVPVRNAGGAARVKYIHIGVGFCVVRSDCMGNAKASKSGTDDGTDSRAFCIYVPFLHKRLFYLREFGWKQKNSTIMDCRLLYEHLMCDAFGLSRKEYRFVSAGYYDSAPEHLPELFAYVQCALLVLSQKVPIRAESIRKLLDELERIGKVTTASLDSLLTELEKRWIIF